MTPFVKWIQIVKKHAISTRRVELLWHLRPLKRIFIQNAATNWFRNVLSELQETIGKDCKITEPYYNITFDLTPLRKDSGYKINGFNNEQLDFNICGKLNKPCGDAAAEAACLDKNNKQLKFGKHWYSHGRHVLVLLCGLLETTKWHHLKNWRHLELQILRMHWFLSVGCIDH